METLNRLLIKNIQRVYQGSTIKVILRRHLWERWTFERHTNRHTTNWTSPVVDTSLNKRACCSSSADERQEDLASFSAFYQNVSAVTVALSIKLCSDINSPWCVCVLFQLANRQRALILAKPNFPRSLSVCLSHKMSTGFSPCATFHRSVCASVRACVFLKLSVALVYASTRLLSPLYIPLLLSLYCRCLSSATGFPNVKWQQRECVCVSGGGRGRAFLMLCFCIFKSPPPPSPSPLWLVRTENINKSNLRIPIGSQRGDTPTSQDVPSTHRVTETGRKWR